MAEVARLFKEQSAASTRPRRALLRPRLPAARSSVRRSSSRRPPSSLSPSPLGGIGDSIGEAARDVAEKPRLSVRVGEGFAGDEHQVTIYVVLNNDGSTNLHGVVTDALIDGKAVASSDQSGRCAVWRHEDGGHSRGEAVRRQPARRAARLHG